jgi:hypothetical protein
MVSRNTNIFFCLMPIHKDHWPWIKVGIDLGYSYHIQTRDPKVKKLMFLLFVLEELIFIWFWWMFFKQ